MQNERKMLPLKRKHFLFLTSSIIHLIIIASIIFIKELSFIVVYEFIFYLAFKNFKAKQFLRIFIIFFIIFILNIFGSDGKIIKEFCGFYITDKGVLNGLVRISALFSTAFFTVNILKENKALFFSSLKNEKIALSISYFYYFFELIQNKFSIKLFYRKILKSLQSKYYSQSNTIYEVKIKTKYFIYNGLISAIGVALLIYKIVIDIRSR
ncbi:MAG TPA: hypothetical protein PK385_03175 [Spirochaetota bacterium]|nr:hypothetical protein [Spirochaetota bacterium]HOS32986.1 hypothetical protein [Spirochaetota bacterium]HOS55041.1 hypothetical protein [Spirochaetota bacterium]HPK61479.1 hypothetical protein [Spirochaetota bacterium]HQF77719.1 hypothetical protein [Spirochaetota bacterium]